MSHEFKLGIRLTLFFPTFIPPQSHQILNLLNVLGAVYYTTTPCGDTITLELSTLVVITVITAKRSARESQRTDS